MDRRTLFFVLALSLGFFTFHLFSTKEIIQAKKAWVSGEASPQQSDPFIAQNTLLKPSSNRQESFYILENETQQLVFSTAGGALAEINLPFFNKDNAASLVRPIEEDRLIAEKAPAAATFPLYPYFLPGEASLQTEGSLSGYYPLLRRNGISSLYAGAIFGAKEGAYRLTRFEKGLIQFEGTANGQRVTKTYHLPDQRQGPYCFDLEIDIDGSAEGLYLSSGVPEVELVSGSYTPLLRYQKALQGKETEVDTIDLPKKGAEQSSLATYWISNCNGFLGLILDTKTATVPGYRTEEIPGKTSPTRYTLLGKPADDYPGYLAQLPLKSGKNSFRIFAGPYDDTLLTSLDDLYDNPIQSYNPNYADAQAITGFFSFISQPFSKLLFFLMNIFHFMTGSWGLSIILLTAALRLMMYPLNGWSIRSSLRMQEVNPKVKALQEKYKKDPKRVQMETLQLYRQEGVNPMTGCLPILIQMPFLIGMFYLLKSHFALRGAPFIPGWIDNLAAPDTLFQLPFSLPLLGDQFHLLPFLVGAVMFVQSRLSANTPKNVTEMTDQQRQQRAMTTLMPIMMILLFYSFPSGLNIYFLFSTLFGILQQKYMMKQIRSHA